MTVVQDPKRFVIVRRDCRWCVRDTVTRATRSTGHRED
jgi:hypothetical protein